MHAYQLSGAVYGPGVYLSARSSVACFYSMRPPYSMTLGPGNNMQCIALCEVINSDSLSNTSGNNWLQTNPSDVCIRFLFVFVKRGVFFIYINSLDTEEVFREAMDAHFQHEGIHI